MVESVKLIRDVTAVQIPFGDTCVLLKDTEVTITYALGGNYTVATEHALYRIANQDADALGKQQLDCRVATDQPASLEDRIWSLLRTCYDPEIPVNIVDLGLVYGVEIAESEEQNRFNITIRMTLTAPGCGMGPVITEDAKQKVLTLAEVKSVNVEIVFDPPWDRSMMSEQAKLELGLF